ncbi:transposase [Austwickia sp. TVS 96-490-7B]|uniref:transposase n=1 Tax=Austwickia sp. TVS 96-490-7B TaxID=2830843 RepID=UPI001C57CC81|nr:transposase [Austwickia sp. TVS 96-490-7B]
MAAPRKYSLELKERATRMAVEARQDPASRAGAIKRIDDRLEVHPQALRTWVKQAEIDGGLRAGTTTEGRRVRKYVKVKTRENVRAKQQRLQEQARRGPVDPESPTIDMYLRRWLAEVFDPCLSAHTRV